MGLRYEALEAFRVRMGLPPHVTPWKIRGGVEVKVIATEEIHASHTAEEVRAWQQSLPPHVRWFV